jgi:hypothetical protein
MRQSSTVWIVLLLLGSLAILLWGARAHWMHKVCPACRYRIPYLATKCPHCHTRQAPSSLAA